MPFFDLASLVMTFSYGCGSVDGVGKARGPGPAGVAVGVSGGLSWANAMVDAARKRPNTKRHERTLLISLIPPDEFMNRMNVGRARVLRPEKHQSLASAMLDINS